MNGQGFAEYAIILAFVALSAMITVTILEPSLGNTFSEIARAEPIAPPSLVDYVAQSTPTPDPNAGPTNTPGGPTETPTNTPEATHTNTPTAVPIGNCGLTLEAETAVLSGLMVVNTDLDPAASGGQYIHVPEGEGDDLTGPNTNSATFNFEVTQADTYQFIGYTYADSADSNSFFVEINGSRIQWDVELGTTYGQDYFNDAFGSDPVEMNLAAGQHTIVVSLREDGTRLDKLTLACSSSGGATATPLPTSTPDNVCTTYSSTSPVSILDESTITSNITGATGNGPIFDLNVNLDLQHTYIGDLDLILTSPSGTAVTLIDRPGASGGGYGCSGNNIFATLDDSAAAPANDQCSTSAPSINGTFAPVNALSAFNGESANGSWQLQVTDNAGGDTGSLTGWSIDVCSSADGSAPPPTATPVAPTPTPTLAPGEDFILPADNLCIGSTTSQSSDAHSGTSNRACDGDRDGVYSNGSVTHTNNETNAWWEVDLGRIYVLQQIKLFNRTDCCGERLSDFYVFISDSPFTSTDLTTTLNDPTVDSFYFEGDVDALAYAFTQQSGRYIRIQLTGTNPLSLAEVEIYGSRDVPPACTTAIDMFYVIDRSGSMTNAMTGANDRMDASTTAITTVNNLLLADGNDNRVGAVSYAGSPYYTNNGLGYVGVNNVTYSVSGNIADFNATVLPSISPGGYTPTGPALNDARLALVEEWDPLRIPVIILLTDGAPNVPADELLHSAGDAANINVFDTNGDPYPLSTIATFGDSVQGTALNQGNILVDVLSSAQDLMNSLPNATIYTIGLGNAGASEFNPELLQYVADIGGGNYYLATSANDLNVALTDIYNSIPTCDGNS